MTSRNIRIVSGVTYITAHNIVTVVRLRHLVTGVNTNLEDVVSWFHISNIYPLAVNVGIVRVVTTWTQTLSVGGAGVSSVVTVVAGRVLQTETGLVSLCYSSVSRCVQQVIMTELVHAVVVLMAAVPFPGVAWPAGKKV